MSTNQSGLEESAINLEIDAGIARFIHASELASNGEYDQAEEEFAKAILLSPELHLARYQLGFLKLLKGQTAQAQLIWSPLRSADVHTTESVTLAAFVDGFAAIANGELDRSIVHFQAGLAHRFANEPLLDDVRKIVARIESALQTDELKNTHPTDERPKEAPTGATHVLLNGYMRSGSF